MCVPFVGVSVFVKTVDDPVFLGAVFVIAPPHLLRQHQRQFVDGGDFAHISWERKRRAGAK